MNTIPGLWPGRIESYDADARTCQVSIPGVTEGSDQRIEAVFSNPLGDRASDTEIRILPGDLVWLMFEGGDPRFPIVIGYRTPRAGNPVDWRRWRHANIEITADGVMRLNATTLEINAAVQIEGASLTHNGKNVGSTHRHGGVQSGGSSTDVPV